MHYFRISVPIFILRRDFITFQLLSDRPFTVSAGVFYDSTEFAIEFVFLLI